MKYTVEYKTQKFMENAYMEKSETNLKGPSFKFNANSGFGLQTEFISCKSGENFRYQQPNLQSKQS